MAESKASAKTTALAVIRRGFTSLLVVVAAALAACEPAGDEADLALSRIKFEVTAKIASSDLAEISGMEADDGPRFLVHNDDGPPDLFVLDARGDVRSRLRVKGARNRDWEDITWVPLENGRVLAIGDIGDNLGRRASIQLYFIELPEPPLSEGRGAIELEPRHVLHLRYPDGPRDCEAMAYDPSSGQILLLTKRDQPPRLYGVDAGQALAERELELEFLGETVEFRPPTRSDYFRLGKDAAWISQPTGMDIDDTGSLAAVISYRSLYLFKRGPQQSWAEAFQHPPREFLGPPSRDEEAIAFSDSMDALFITTEGQPAPVYRVELPPPRD